MKKKALFLALILIVCCLLSAAVAAVQERGIEIIPGLTFTGTTANCVVVVGSDYITDEIVADIELWRGNRRLATWTASDYGELYFSDTYSVTSGYSYTLKVFASINGESMPMAYVRNECQ